MKIIITWVGSKGGKNKDFIIKTKLCYAELILMNEILERKRQRKREFN